MNFANRIKIFLSCNKVGDDEFGNSYYEEKHQSADDKKKRYVIYNGIIESSKVPSEWHHWLHHTSKAAPINNNSVKKYSWQKIHLPNLIGTSHSYSPSSNSRKSGDKKINKSYQSWNPENL